jgi:hypothetical protein
MADDKVRTRADRPTRGEIVQALVLLEHPQGDVGPETRKAGIQVAAWLKDQRDRSPC